MYSWLLACLFIHFSASSPAKIFRIVGGENASIVEFPYQVSLSYGLTFLCGGSIISTQYALTAAHCTYKDPTPDRYSVRSGSTFTFKEGIEHKVTKIIVHEKFIFQKTRISNDICLLKVSPQFVYDDTHKKIALYGSPLVIPGGTMSTVSGFGKPSENKESTKRLQSINIPIINWQYCHNFYAKINITLSRDSICAGITDNTKSSCQGDSGGPLVVEKKLVGLVSWGIGCTKPNYPGVYTSIFYFVNWIMNKIAQNNEQRMPVQYNNGYSYPTNNLIPDSQGNYMPMRHVHKIPKQMRFG